MIILLGVSDRKPAPLTVDPLASGGHSVIAGSGVWISRGVRQRHLLVIRSHHHGVQ